MQQEEAAERQRLEEEEHARKLAKQKVWEDIVKAGGGSIVFNATMIDGDGILALSKTDVIVSVFHSRFSQPTFSSNYGSQVHTEGQLKVTARRNINNIANTGVDRFG
jgi:hypothetical protein